MYLILSLLLIIILHELGHFIAAKLCKCRVEVFAVGFGKTLFAKKFKNIIYQLNLIPLGGFCQLKGELDYSKSKYCFTNKTYSQKVFIALAGVLVNILTGIPALYFGYHMQVPALFYFGYYSLIIGISNALPIPALDGSYPLWFLLEYKYGKKRTYEIMRKVFSVSFKILMFLNIISLPIIIYLIQTKQIM